MGMIPTCFKEIVTIIYKRNGGGLEYGEMMWLKEFGFKYHKQHKWWYFKKALSGVARMELRRKVKGDLVIRDIEKRFLLG